jgi:hypothetical protein
MRKNRKEMIKKEECTIKLTNKHISDAIYFLDGGVINARAA